MNLIKQLDLRRKYEEREKRKHQAILDKLILREKKLAQRKRDSEILNEIRKPTEDSEIPNQKEFPKLERIPGNQLAGQALADLMMSFEFLHTFGETLGFDMESLPTMQSLHQALASDDAVEAEEELLSVMTHLLVCAIEDPGIPNPARHTTLLGQSLRQADITNSNISEILRIYLYAVATGEVKQMTGINFERDRDRKVADHHSTESDVNTSQSGKNSQYYEHLHENTRWKLSECLKDQPYVSLNPSLKAQILALLCNDLLMNKAVVKKIDGSLESVAQLKRERYLLENKIRKYKSWHGRKQRMEMFEKSQALAIERANAIKAEQAEAEAKQLANESVNNEGIKTIDITDDNTADNITDTPSVSVNTEEPIDKQAENLPTETNDQQTESTEKIPAITNNDILPEVATPPQELDTNSNKKNNFSFNDSQQNVMSESNPVCNPIDTTLSSSTPDINSLLTKSIISTNNETALDDDISDLESECTMMEEDEDAKITADEVHKKLEKVLKQSYQTSRMLEQSSQQLRAQCYGQDRYWRRYWHLPKAGGIYVEALESGQPEIYKYHTELEEQYVSELEMNPKEEREEEENQPNKTEEETKPEIKDETEPMEEGVVETKEEPQNEDDVLAAVNAVANVKEEAEIESDDTFKENPNDETPIEYKQHDNNDNNSTPVTTIKTEPQPEEPVDVKPKIDTTINCIDDDDDDDVIEVKPTIENGLIKVEPISTDFSIKQEIKEDPDAKATDKWFSILNREIQLSSSEYTACTSSQIAYSNITCEVILQVQGNRWDIGNNVQHFNIPLDNNSPSCEIPVSESYLTLSGIDDNLISSVVEGKHFEQTALCENKMSQDQDGSTNIGSLNDIDGGEYMLNESKNEFKSNLIKSEDGQGFVFPPSINMSLLNLSTYIQCESPSPLQMSPEEYKLLEQAKVSYKLNIIFELLIELKLFTM